MPSTEQKRCTDYLAPGNVLMNKSYYDNPEKMRIFFREYVKSIKDEGIQPDAAKFAGEMVDGFLNEFQHGINAWRKIIEEETNK